jgi:hypothetical protein
MQVTITYNDDTAFTVEEIVKLATNNYGKSTNVQVMPDSAKPHDLIYFALQCMITHEQLSLLYEDKFAYASKLQKLRGEILYKLSEILDQVIIDNESKVA